VVLRIAHPGKPLVLRDLGPAHGRRLPYFAMRREIDEAIAASAANHRRLMV
jgi:hypothetical protein